MGASAAGQMINQKLNFCYLQEPQRRQGDAVRVRGEARTISWQKCLDLKSNEFCRLRLLNLCWQSRLNDEVRITRVKGTTLSFSLVTVQQFLFINLFYFMI